MSLSIHEHHYSINGFLLTRHSEISDQSQNLVYWMKTDEGYQKVVLENQPSVCFFSTYETKNIERILTGSDIQWWTKPLKLKNFEGNPVSALYCSTQTMQYQAVQLLHRVGLQLWEDDIQPVERFLMERNIQAGLTVKLDQHKVTNATPCDYRPKLSALSLDIETAAWSPNVIPELYSISMQMGAYRWTGFLHRDGANLPTESEHCFVTSNLSVLLSKFLEQINYQDPDLIIGWNLINFDFRVLQYWFDQQNIPFCIGRNNDVIQWRQPDPSKDQWHMKMQGRVVLDGIDVLRMSFHFYENYSLNFVAEKVLGQQKLVADTQDKVAEIHRMYLENPDGLIEYNLLDCQLVSDIFQKLNLIDFLVARSFLTGLPLDRMGGSAAAFNNLYLPRLHRKGYVAPSVGSQNLTFSSPGGYVFDSIPGIYKQILVLDFKSLYPSIIQTFKIDPLGLIVGLSHYATTKAPLVVETTDQVIQGYDGGCFSRDQHILPDLIQKLWQQRDDAKKQKDGALSQAIKILMNSFYGVLGSNLCRFYDPRLSSSITKRGHQIMKASKTWIEQQGHQVIYGDTDSLFVHVTQPMDPDSLNDLGSGLAVNLNAYWQNRIESEFQLASCLEIEFETCYQRFLMPTIRNAEKGSKKRYSGLQINSAGQPKIIFKGLEAVRSDWTPLAKQFQTELYRLVFTDQPYQQWLKKFVQDLKEGKLDDLLVFHRRVKKEPEEYAKGLPPSAQAVKQLQRKYPGRHFSRVDYLITVNGVEPMELQQSMPDYDFYVQKQLKPIADAILHFLGDDFDRLITQQMPLI